MHACLCKCARALTDGGGDSLPMSGVFSHRGVWKLVFWLLRHKRDTSYSDSLLTGGISTAHGNSEMRWTLQIWHWTAGQEYAQGHWEIPHRLCLTVICLSWRNALHKTNYLLFTHAMIYYFYTSNSDNNYQLLMWNPCSINITLILRYSKYGKAHAEYNTSEPLL